MSGVTSRARLLALLVDLLVCAGAGQLAALLLTGVLRLAGASGDVAARVWPAAGAGALAAFLLRDARGGRSRRWFGLVVTDRTGNPPGAFRSIGRNLALLVPVWNLFEAWPLLRDGSAPRPSDRRLGTRLAASD